MRSAPEARGKGGGSMKIFRKVCQSGQAGRGATSYLKQFLAILFLGALAAPFSYSQEADPTARAARLSNVDGQVQLSQRNQILADHAVQNTPLFEGSELKTADDGRAEIQFDDGSIVRISPNSSVKVSVLRQQGGAGDAEVQLESGLGYFELQGDTASGHIRARFGDSVVTATGFTVLRINLDTALGEVAVFSGNAHLERANALALDLRGGESVGLSGADPSRYNLSQTIEPDSWDAWNSDRDQLLTSQEAAKTAATTSINNSNNPAWSDLDANGNWYDVPGQGYVWSPYAATNAGWDPYGCGNWVWTPRFGYIWVSCESWGYMPYASGNWNYYDGFGWGWYPGYGNPWWCGGGWGFNVGTTPVRYQPPHRPRGIPIRPPGGGGSPIRGGQRFQLNPVVPVNRVKDRGYPDPVRVRTGGPVTIAGNVVQPLRPVSPRPVYGSDRSVVARPGFTVFPRDGANGRQGQTAWPSTGPPATGGNAYRPSGTSSGYYPYVPSPSAPSRGYVPGGGAAPSRPVSGVGGGGSHVSGGGGGSPHVSSGGGGGGGGHVSSGSGGGGGSHGGGSSPAPSGGHH